MQLHSRVTLSLRWLLGLISLSFRWLLSLISLCISTLVHASSINMTPGVTPISHSIFELHMTVFWICVAIGIVVFSVMIYTLIAHRKSVGHKASEFHEHPGLEITWSIIPFIILIIMAIPATKLLMAMNDDSQAALTIKITGYQWKWRYEYLDQGISFFSNLSTPRDQLSNNAPKDKWYLLEVDHPLVLPVDEKIRFLITSNDVIHSWWVPALGIKKDAIPGFIHEAWARIDQPGTYRGACAELCGTNHGFMPIVVEAVSQQDFAKWVQQQTSANVTTTQTPPKLFTKDEQMKAGEVAYNNTCAVCHKPEGVGMPPMFPALKGSKVATGPLAIHIHTVLYGRPGTAMQAFASQLNDEDIAAIITYERNAWGNNTGDVVQPAQIAAARNK